MIPYYRAKSNERNNIYIEGLLIGVDEELNLCTIRTKDDYIGGEICYLHTLSINFPNMLDSQGNKIFASLQKDGRGGDNVLYSDYKTIYTMVFDNLKGVYAKNISNEYDTGYKLNPRLKIIGIQQ